MFSGLFLNIVNQSFHVRQLCLGFFKHFHLIVNPEDDAMMMMTKPVTHLNSAITIELV
jgi:hypothetical protein